MSETVETGKPVDWYRCPVPRDTLQALNRRSDFLAYLQTLGFLAVLILTGAFAWYIYARYGILYAIPAIFLHGTCFAFQINAVHELGHKTVFRGRRTNSFFEHIFAFLGWINHRMFWNSHLRHHRYTLHPPDDLEVTLPIKLTRKEFLKHAIINPWGFWWTLKYTNRIARGHFSGEWELKLYPPTETQKRREAINWARSILLGHSAILIVSVLMGWWLLPVLTTFAAFYGGWLQFLCNNTQHVGLQENVPDFRLCCRTMYLNPFARFLYWHMNYHTEHHMYPGVPCYKLGALHRAIRPDMPRTHGLLGAWREIATILKRQKSDPSYFFAPELPASPPPAGEVGRGVAHSAQH